MAAAVCRPAALTPTLQALVCEVRLSGNSCTRNLASSSSKGGGGAMQARGMVGNGCFIWTKGGLLVDQILPLNQWNAQLPRNARHGGGRRQLCLGCNIFLYLISFYYLLLFICPNMYPPFFPRSGSPRQVTTVYYSLKPFIDK